MKKKYVCILCSLFIFTISAFAQKQKTSFAVAAGISSSFYSSDSKGNNTSDFKTGFTGGATINFKTSTHWSIEPGLFFVQKGGKETDNIDRNVTLTTTLNYLELPVNMIYSKREKFFWGFGAFAGLGLSGKIKSKGSVIGDVPLKFGNGVNDLKPIDAGVNLLVSYHFQNNLFISANIVTSLNNISNDDQYYFSNAYLGIKLGYIFPHQKNQKK